ncbi:MAG: reverse transcriptase domain-containing protein [Smithella sp.]
MSLRTEGTPQGGPLSPLLSNILLSELDRELERRGHAFCRYADDCNIYVRSQRAGERVMASITRFLSDTLKFTVNVAKSAVATVETSVHTCQESDEGGIEGGASVLLGFQSAGAVVEQWCKPHEPGLPEVIL